MKFRMILGGLWVLLALGSMPAASAAGTYCVGFFENTSYAALLGLARYRMVCDNGSSASVQRDWVYTGEARAKLYQEEVPALASRFGVSRIRVRKDDLSGSYDVFVPRATARPERVALLTRSLFRMGDGWLEKIQIQDEGKITAYPELTIPSPKDRSNVNAIAEGQGWRRSREISPSRTRSTYGVFVLHR